MRCRASAGMTALRASTGGYFYGYIFSWRTLRLCVKLNIMKIVVCVKPAPDPKRWDSIQMDPVTKALTRERDSQRSGIPG